MQEAKAKEEAERLRQATAEYKSNIINVVSQDPVTLMAASR